MRDSIGWAILLDIIAAVILFFCYTHPRHRVTHGRLLPLSILTLLHTFLFLLMFSADFLVYVYLLYTPAAMLFGIIYMIVLSEKNKLNRITGPAVAVFTVNFLLQSLFMICLWAYTQGG